MRPKTHTFEEENTNCECEVFDCLNTTSKDRKRKKNEETPACLHRIPIPSLLRVFFCFLPPSPKFPNYADNEKLYSRNTEAKTQSPLADNSLEPNYKSSVANHKPQSRKPQSIGCWFACPATSPPQIANRASSLIANCWKEANLQITRY